MIVLARTLAMQAYDVASFVFAPGKPFFEPRPEDAEIVRRDRESLSVAVKVLALDAAVALLRLVGRKRGADGPRPVCADRLPVGRLDVTGGAKEPPRPCEWQRPGLPPVDGLSSALVGREPPPARNPRAPGTGRPLFQRASPHRSGTGPL